MISTKKMKKCFSHKSTKNGSGIVAQEDWGINTSSEHHGEYDDRSKMLSSCGVDLPSSNAPVSVLKLRQMKNNNNTETTGEVFEEDAYMVTVPEQVNYEEPFCLRVNGERRWARYPPDAVPGAKVKIVIPPETPNVRKIERRRSSRLSRRRGNNNSKMMNKDKYFGSSQSLGGSSDSMETTPVEQQSYMITVPKGVKARKKFTVTIEGESFEVTRPRLIFPRMRMKVMLRAPTPTDIVTDVDERYQIVEVKIPDDVYSGMRFHVTVDGVQHLLTCPMDNKPGDVINAKILSAAARLNIGNASGIEVALERLKENEKVEEVLIAPFVPSINQQQFTTLFDALSKLTRLKSINLDFFTINPCPVNGFLKFLSASDKLESIELVNACLTDNPEEVDELAQALREHPSLQKILLRSCRIPNLDVVVEELAKNVTLQEVGLINTWAGEPLVHLCSSPTLKKLRLGGSHALANTSDSDGEEITHDDHVKMIAKELETNQSLRELSITLHNLGEDAYKSLGQMLRVNRTLRSLTLRLDKADMDKNAIHIAQSLQQNRNLRCLELDFNGSMGDDVVDSFTELVQNNLVLEVLILQHSGKKQITYQSLLPAYLLPGHDFEVLAGNRRVRIRPPPQVRPGEYVRFRVPDTKCALNEEINFYLKLNRHGRRSLLENDNASINKWVESLISVKNNLSSLYYLMKTNPLLVEHINDNDDDSNNN